MIKLTDELKNDFLIYAQEVNNNRAFPDARDSLKISQRACLWAMQDSGYSSAKPHVKSAKVDGNVIANFHPHGSEYLTIVRLSQDWLLNIPLISFHGANGSALTGDEAAASRYTEVRLDKAAEDAFFTNIKKNTVDFIPNYSEDILWPGNVLPCVAPLLLVNGSSGIGYTIAQDWLPHNLGEVVEKVKEYVATGKVSTDNIYPDFPIGGTIINKKDCRQIYETGKGSVILRGKTEIIDNYINITELPYQVYAEPFIQKIKDLVNAGTLSGVEDICNKSGDHGLLIEIECSENPQVVLNKLYKLTDLQVTFSANQMALVDGIPQMLNLKNYIKVYVDHNIECLKREYKFDLDKAEVRKEIVDGLVRAISIIDDIIKTIKAAKSSESAKQDLISTFNFTENQARAIVDMRLGKLANLEIVELNKELTELVKTIDNCNKFLASDKLQKKEFISRLEEFTNNYGWTRRTEVIDVDLDAEKAVLKKHNESISENYIICLTKNNMIKRIIENSYKPNAKVDDKIINAIKVDIKDRVILISSDGTMYKLDVRKIDLCNMNSSGMSLKELVNNKIINIYSGTEEEQYLILTTKHGLIKKIESKVVFELSKCVGAPIMRVDENDEIIDCRLANDSDKITLIYGKKSRTINISDLVAKGRGAGGIVGIKMKTSGYLDRVD